VTEALRRLVDLWNGFWFRPEHRLDLGIGRLLICAALALYLIPRSPFHPTAVFTAVTYIPEALWRPISSLRFLGLEPPDLGPMRAIYGVAMISLAAVAVGAFTRTASAVLAVSAGYLLLIPYMWGKVDHAYNVLAMCVFLLPFAPAGAALSVDAWRAERRGAPFPDRDPSYGWVLLLCKIAFGLMLFFATMSKIKKGGWEWIDSQSLRNILLAQNYARPDVDPSPLVPWVAAEPWRWKLAAAGAVTTQFLFVFIVFIRNRWLKALWLSFGLGFLIGLDVMMRLPNPVLMILLGLFVPWADLLEWYRTRSPADQA
jgi:hypothetical protein